jgi:hypothetical protein
MPSAVRYPALTFPKRVQCPPSSAPVSRQPPSLPSLPARPPLSRRRKPMDGADERCSPTGQQKQKRSIYVLHKPVKFSCPLHAMFLRNV